MKAYVVRVPLIVALLMVPACGGGSSGSSGSSTSSSAQPANFKASFTAAANQLKETSHAIGLSIQNASSHTDAQLGSTFHTLAQRWQTQVDKLQKLTPPSAVSAPFATLTAAAKRTEADLSAIASAAQTHSAAAAKQAATTLITDILRAKAASTTITNKLGTQ